MAQGSIPMTPVALTTSSADYEKKVDPISTGAGAILVFDNTDSAVAFNVSVRGTAAAAGRVTSFIVPAYGSYTTPKEVDLSQGVWIQRIGASNVVARLSGWY